MFYTLIQEPIDGEYRSERFVCFEADSKEHAIERAEWFGINIEERVGGDNGYRRWWWHNGSCNTREPMVSGIPMDRVSIELRGDEWIVVYKNNNLKSSRGITLENAIRNQSLSDSFAEI